jgi:hypothetical protein
MRSSWRGLPLPTSLNNLIALTPDLEVDVCENGVIVGARQGVWTLPHLLAATSAWRTAGSVVEKGALGATAGVTKGSLSRWLKECLCTGHKYSRWTLPLCLWLPLRATGLSGLM